MNKNFMSFLHPAFLISTFFGAGKIPYMSGTIGSLIGLLLFAMISYFSKYFNPFYIFYFYLGIILFIFIIGTIAADIYAKQKNDPDPKEVIIDEVLGQMLALCFTTFVSAKIAQDKSLSIFFLLVFVGPFIVFRVYDILKPWPISWFDENIKNGFGIMLDDIMAAIFTIITYNALLYQFAK